MTYINLINLMAGFLVVAYTTFGLFVLHDEKTVKLSWHAYGAFEALVILSIIVVYKSW